MSSIAPNRANVLSRISLCAVVFWSVPVMLSSQTLSITQQANTHANQMFATLDDSLTRAANTLLVPPAPRSDPSPGEANGQGTPNIPVNTGDQLRPALLGVSMTLAVSHLALLRPVIEPILRSHGVPTNMMAVVAVESGGNSTALSPKGARGLWQLMPDTARRYGLRVDEIHDDRLDLYKATDAAARYLHDLYIQFGDWKLALAAYNTGEANVGAAILRAHTQDFEQLVNLRVLPLETRNYVPRVLATAEFFGRPLISEEGHPAASARTIFAVTEH